VLDSIGRTILGVLDYRISTMLALFCYLILGTISFLINKSWPTTEKSLAGVLYILSLFGAVSILGVFDLTDPPAIEMLSGESQSIIGVICVLVLVSLGIKGIKDSFFRHRWGND
jgi:hypothetical protein